ncbi:MAG: hypothetical protein AB1798_01950 [Spirochaetota bacterium]
MEIKINDEVIDFTLENEKTLGDVTTAIDSWLKKSGFIVTSFKKDKKELPLTRKEEWFSTPLEYIGELEVLANLPGEIRLENLNTACQFFSMLAKGVQASNHGLIKELMEEYHCIKENLDTMMGSSINKVDTISAALEELTTAFTSEASKRILPVINGTILMLKERMREIVEPVKELKATTDLLKKSADEISEVAVLLQTGKDREAMDFIIHFTELSQKLIRLYPFLKEAGIMDVRDVTIDKLSFKEFYKDLNRVLKQVIDAFQVEDSVLIGDLLEYEVAPRLNTFVNFINGGSLKK